MSARRLAWLSLSLSLVGAWGCDGGVSVRGAVHRWANAPLDAQGRIIVDQAWSLPIELTPLPGVELTIFHSPEDAALGDAAFFPIRAVSEPDGSFDFGGTTRAGKHAMAIRAARAGCNEALATFVNHGSGGPHTVQVILVCPDDAAD